MFNMADKNQSGDLNFNEFKSFANDTQINQVYKENIKRARL